MKLEEMDTSCEYFNAWHDSGLNIYYTCEGKNGEIYCVLYPDFDLERAQSKYIGCVSVKILIASQKQNALDSIGLEKINGRIIEKNRKSNSNSFINRFIEDLKKGKLKIEIFP